MARELTEQNRRDAEILQAALRLIKKNGGQMHYKEIQKELPKIFKFTEQELEPRKSWEAFWHALLGMVGGIELKRAGIIETNKGEWYLTEEGKKSLSLSPDDFFRLYRSKWNEYAKSKTKQIPELDENVPEVADVPKTVAIIIGESRGVIRDYILSKNAYEFQNLIAALLRGMGYHTPFVAEKGPDGGIDIVAYQDQLGVKGSHIKVQVKHKPNTNEPVNTIRELAGILSKPNEVGIVVTSGNFTKECRKEAYKSHLPIRLIDMGEFIDLWIEHYANLSDEDRKLLPITPVYHLNTDMI